MNDGCGTQLFLYELFASPVPVFSSLCQLGGRPFLSPISCHCHSAFRSDTPKTLCFCSFRTKSCPSVEETKASRFFHLRERWKLALSYLPGGLQCSKCSSLPRRLYMTLAWACFPSLENRPQLKWVGSLIPTMALLQWPWTSSLLGCKMPGGGVQGTRYRIYPREVLEMVRGESWRDPVYG